MKQYKSRRASQGFLSIEAMVVLVIVLGLMGLAASKMGLLGSNSDQLEEMSNIQSLYTATRSMRGSSGYGTSGTSLSATLVSLQSYPKNMTMTANVFYNKWGGEVAVASTGAGFTISTAGVPKAECASIASKLSRGGTFASTKINSNTAATGEITAATAATQCSTDSNTIVFASAS